MPRSSGLGRVPRPGRTSPCLSPGPYQAGRAEAPSPGRIGGGMAASDPPTCSGVFGWKKFSGTISSRFRLYIHQCKPFNPRKEC